jgi:hypothetical protein
MSPDPVLHYTVVDNVENRMVRAFDKEDDAAWLCRGLNLQAGPGGRYSVAQRPGTVSTPTTNERKPQ